MQQQASSLTIPPQTLQNLKQILQLLRASKNPNELLMMAANKNPMMRQLQQIGNQYGGDYDKAFADICRQNNLDPSEVMGALRGVFN